LATGIGSLVLYIQQTKLNAG